MTREVIFAPEARDDLLKLYDDIAAASDPERALSYTERIRAYCQGLQSFPERGRARDDVRPNLRITSFERRVTIAFHVTPEAVIIDGIFYAGRYWEHHLRDDGDE